MNKPIELSNSLRDAGRRSRFELASKPCEPKALASGGIGLGTNSSRPGLAPSAQKRYGRFSIVAVAVLGIILAVGAIGIQGASADWPFERGDAAATAATSGDFSKQPTELWRYEIEESGFEVTPVVAKGVAYLGDVDGTFYAVKLDNGDLVWKKKFADSGFIAAAAVVDGRIFVGDFNGLLRCLAADSGKLLWNYEARGEMYAGANVQAGRVLVTTEAGELLCLNADSGKLEWQFDIEAPLRCWPTVVAGNVFLAGCDSRLHSVDFQSGQETKSIELAGQTGSSPARWKESMYFGTVSGTFYRIDDLAVTWTFQDEAQQQSYSAATSNGKIVYTTKGKKIYALNPKDGKVEWESSVRVPVESSPIIVGNSVLFGTKRGRLVALVLSSGDQQWEYEAGGDFLASPAVDNGRLLIANSDGTLYCFGSEKLVPNKD